MASSSASRTPSSADIEWKYDVFLSFRGADTRKGITSDLYDRLHSSGIKTFMDDPDLEVGDAISRTLIEAIEQSRFAVVVLSRDYASSTWCLEELAKICECMEDKKRILPLFYHVDPTDVRYQKKSFQEAFSKHESSGRHESQKVKQWRSALNKVATFSGWNTNDYKTHKELTDVIVEFLRNKVVPEAIESVGDFQAFEATRQALNKVKNALKDEEVTAIGVYGMGGVGKTTLVEHIGAQARKSGNFDYVAKGVVSQNPQFKKLQHALAEQLGFKFDEKTEIGRAAKLRKEIMRREKILIILDDIWQGIELSRIGIPSYKELRKCKSKLLLTTRIRNVCHAMECQEKITLNVLSEQDAWTLFVRKARRSFESPTFEDVAKKVARECKGLPIALITVARALGDEELVEWKRAAQRLEKSQTANTDDYGEAFKCIKLSYDYLKDEEYKSYFLLCCLFPEDDDIAIEDLFRYAIGKGLFLDDETLGEARGRADSVARHLKYSSLLLEGTDSKYIKMHDVVRDAALRIAESEYGFLVKAGCGLEDWPRRLRGSYSAMSLMGNDIKELPKKLVCPKLQILLLNRNSIREIPETFFQSPNELRVLDLSFTVLSLLPQSFSLLTNLQALYLDGIEDPMNNISMLGKLENLEILSMRNSSLMELSIEIGGLTNLRMLDISGGEIFRLPPKVILQLHNLEELYLEGFWGWGSKVSEEPPYWSPRSLEWEGEVQGERGEETNAGFDEVTSLSNLTVLEVCFSSVESIPKYVEFEPKLVKFDIRIGIDEYNQSEIMRDLNPNGENSVCLDLDIISRLPDWFWDEIMNIAERLEWNGGRRLIDIFVEYELGRLHGLKCLLIVGPERKKPMNTMTWIPNEPVFENLEELHLLRLEWAELSVFEFLPPGSLFNLKVLKIRLCYNWGSILLPSTLLQRLLNLERLYCAAEEESKYVFGYEEALLVSKRQKLRDIELCDLATVSICEGPAPAAMFQNLSSLTIKRCYQLQGSLFSYDVAQCLSQLNCLVLEGCLLLERIVEPSNKKIILPKLKKLSLTELPVLCYEIATFDIECPSLEESYVKDCPKFSASSSDFHSKNQVELPEGKELSSDSSAYEGEDLVLWDITEAYHDWENSTTYDKQHQKVAEIEKLILRRREFRKAK